MLKDISGYLKLVVKCQACGETFDTSDQAVCHVQSSHEKDKLSITWKSLGI